MSAHDIDPTLVETCARSRLAVANGALLRWPGDQRLREDALRRRAQGADDPAAEAFTAAFAALLSQLDRVCVTVELQRARMLVMLCGMVPPNGWLPLPERLADADRHLGRATGATEARVREIELELDGRTAVAVVRAVAEALVAVWALQPVPPPEQVPGTPEYRARLRADLAADIAEIDRTLERWDRLIALDRAERDAREGAQGVV